VGILVTFVPSKVTARRGMSDMPSRGTATPPEPQRQRQSATGTARAQRQRQSHSGTAKNAHRGSGNA